MVYRKPIYVETCIQSPVEQVWEYTQDPSKHTEWDLRFSRIEYLPRPDASKPQRFLYQTRIGFGLVIQGEGESMGTIEKENGERTSSLRFSAEQKISLIRKGAGYWKYVPVEEGTRFFTQYDYQTRFGILGEWVDKLAFRPLMGWATAWSFDALRLWLEKQIHPSLSFRRSLIQYLIVFTLAFVWVYQGFVPKIWFPDTGEMELLRGTGWFAADFEMSVVTVAGLMEILFGFLFLWLWRTKGIFIINIVLMLALGAAAALGDAAVWTAPFNPVTFNVSLAVLSFIALLNRTHLPDARHCKRTRRERDA